jgi:hypothetical protein
MIKIDKKNAEEWINRFLNGETSNAEEQELYRFFAGKDVPHRLRKYQSMFSWYAEGMQQTLADRKRHSKLRFYTVRLSIAAAILLTIGIGIRLYQDARFEEEYSCYEGSYIIRNGKKITDLKQILPELKSTIQVAEQRDQKIRTELNKTPSDYIKEFKEESVRESDKKENLPII